jgi:hypothetical protein
VDFDDGYSITVERHNVCTTKDKVPKRKLGKVLAVLPLLTQMSGN